LAHRILVIEDDHVTADYIVKGLNQEGFVTDHVADGRDGLFHGTDGDYDCIVLDRMLPRMDGMAVLGALRGAGIETPVIILSALDTPEDRVAGLTGGSDDYLTKPFAFAELLARIRLLIRRGKGHAAPVATRLTCDDLELDVLSRKVRRGGQAITLQPREFRLLEYLLRHADQVVSRTMLLEGVWDYHFDPATNVIDVHMSHLRKKIDEGHPRPLLHTIRGAGYRLGLGD
jgi:two-component system, OmpR family, response regulator